MARFSELFPPYGGDQPYLYFCFSDADKDRLRPLFRRLYERGCRIWYPTGHSGTVAERERRDARMRKARLVVLYQTKRARTDQAVKSAVLVCQEKSIPIISVDVDNAESTLSMGLDSRAVHIKLRSVDAAEAALLHADGFSQELIGPPLPVRKKAVLAIAAAIVAAAFLLIGAAVLVRRLRAPSIEKTGDTVFFSDPVLTAAVRDALSGEPITEDSIVTVTTLRFDTLPERTDEFALLSNLSRIELNQANAADAASLIDRYEIVLTGGGQ